MAKVTLSFKSKLRMEEEILPIVAKKNTVITLPIQFCPWLPEIVSQQGPSLVKDSSDGYQ